MTTGVVAAYTAVVVTAYLWACEDARVLGAVVNLLTHGQTAESSALRRACKSPFTSPVAVCPYQSSTAVTVNSWQRPSDYLTAVQYSAAAQCSCAAALLCIGRVKAGVLLNFLHQRCHYMICVDK